MKCDMCGSEGKLYQAVIEDAKLKVCHECSKFGKVIGIVEQENINEISTRSSQESKTEIMNILVDDYGGKIRNKRESLGLNQSEFAKKVSEKESLIQKIESEHFEPSIGLAKKIGKFLKLKLTEEYEEQHEAQVKSKTDSFTLGDFIKKKNK